MVVLMDEIMMSNAGLPPLPAVACMVLFVVVVCCAVPPPLRSCGICTAERVSVRYEGVNTYIHEVLCGHQLIFEFLCTCVGAW